MLFFMSLADGFRQPGLIIHVLNGQARFMVSAHLLSFSSFCMHLLILFLERFNDVVMYTQALHHIPDWVHEFDSGTWTCSLSSPNLTGAHPLGWQLDRIPICGVRLTWLQLFGSGRPHPVPLPPHLRISSANSRQPSSTGFRTPLNLKTKTASPSSMPAYRTHSRTRGVSTGKSQFFHLSF